MPCTIPAFVQRRAFRLLASFTAALAAPALRSFRVRLLAGGIALVAGSAPASASSLIVPGSFAAAEGDSSYAFINFSGITYQQAFDASLLTGFVVGDVITGLQFRLDATEPNSPASSIVIANFDVYLGPSAFSAGSLSSSVAGNQSPGTILARSGSLNIPANSFTGGAGPNPFGLQIVFTTPFTYTGGNLLLTLTYTNPPADLFFDTASTVTGAQIRTDIGYNSTTVNNNLGSQAIVTKFTYTAAPEPTTVGLLLLGAGILGLRRRQV